MTPPCGKKESRATRPRQQKIQPAKHPLAAINLATLAGASVQFLMLQIQDTCMWLGQVPVTAPQNKRNNCSTILGVFYSCLLLHNPREQRRHPRHPHSVGQEICPEVPFASASLSSAASPNTSALLLFLFLFLFWFCVLAPPPGPAARPRVQSAKSACGASAS